MKNGITFLSLTVGGLLALAAGCGKRENAAPPTTETVQPTPAAKAEPTVTAEQPVTQTTDAVATVTDTAKATPETPARPVAAAATPVQEPAPKAVVAANPLADTTKAVAGQTNTPLASLSQDQVVEGLKGALGKGLEQAVARLGHDGGFLTNASVRIPMPEKLQKVESTLRAMKQDQLAADFVTTMNHAAEQAVPEAGSVFADALRQMTIADAKTILGGPKDAATQYFQKTTQTNLYARFYPIVQKATAKTGVTAAYKQLLEKANVGQSLGGLGSTLGGTLLGKDSLDIDAYVANKAMDGLFKMVAEEEQQIRQNAVARTTDVLQKVFGALTK